ncbi:MAG: glycosyltransferase [Deltaproteobacteria bacterium]|nr:glycosyltransferase [Deltaproteobacteria bacterium]
MNNPQTPEGVADSKVFWNDLTERLGNAVPLENYGTLTDSRAVVALRDDIEQAHVFRLLRLTPATCVLDLGGGAGRFALRIAPKVARVTLVDVSEALLDVARSHARAAGISNITFINSSIQEFRFEGFYDVILILGVTAYLTDEQLSAIAESCARVLRPGGQLILKEPVTTDGVAREQFGKDPRIPYYARFRPRETYARVFGRWLSLDYQRPTVAHFIPWFLGGTESAAQATQNAFAQWLLKTARPILTRIDPWMLAMERRVRASPRFSALLAPVPVLQDLYLFTKPTPSECTESSDASLLELSVVVIAYNEELCIVRVVGELESCLAAAAISYEIVLVDDGSSDNTLSMMRRIARRSERIRVVPLVPNRGIGAALRAGFDAAKGNYISWIPADGQIPPEVVIELFQRRAEASMLTTVYHTRQDPWFRKLISNSLNSMIKLRTGRTAKSGGNYLFSRRAWKVYAPAPDDSMMISTAFRHNLLRHGESIIEVEIDCRARLAGSSKVLNFRTIWRTLDALLRKSDGWSRR